MWPCVPVVCVHVLWLLLLLVMVLWWWGVGGKGMKWTCRRHMARQGDEEARRCHTVWLSTVCFVPQCAHQRQVFLFVSVPVPFFFCLSFLATFVSPVASSRSCHPPCIPCPHTPHQHAPQPRAYITSATHSTHHTQPPLHSSTFLSHSCCHLLPRCSHVTAQLVCVQSRPPSWLLPSCPPV